MFASPAADTTRKLLPVIHHLLPTVPQAQAARRGPDLSTALLPGGRSEGTELLPDGREDAALVSLEHALLDAPGDGRYLADARIRRHERRNALHTLHGLMELARHAEKRPELLAASPGIPLAKVSDVIRRVQDPLIRAQLVGKTLAAGERDIALRLGSGSSLSGHPERAGEIATVLGNLIDNAMDAVACFGTPDPRVEVSFRDTGCGVELGVTDNGTGVSPDLRELIFARGFSTKRRTGVRPRGEGLALVRDIAGAYGGTVEVADRDGGGAVFTVRMPLLYDIGRSAP
ncbi:histidine kinase/DNA gyrase B/HSP90-like ATPase [Streptomyces brevispora]|uniref:histidine kinase n=1 Tax=Streptomyces brevispora TaxID=887462 RepID=A0A561UR48_9ACTN|nr:histidine kinase/DNA gyrase B/HSP90-like ATPase [Streptomyces brevispora]